MQIRIFGLALALSAVTALAQPIPVWMSDEAIKTAFAGVTINGIYVDGLTFTETYAAAGDIVYQDPRKAMTGRWSIINQSFCTLYNGGISGGCFKVAQQSANCFEFYFQSSTEAEAAKPAPGQPSWTARGWNSARLSTCDEKPLA